MVGWMAWLGWIEWSGMVDKHWVDWLVADKDYEKVINIVEWLRFKEK